MFTKMDDLRESLRGIFFTEPTRKFHLRGLARLLKTSPTTASKAVRILAKEGLIIRKKGEVMDEIYANQDSERFTIKKRIYNISSVFESGLVKFLREHYNEPDAVILFGSYARGDDAERSDIDIAVITKKQIKLDLDKFEKRLKRPISIHEVDLNKISKEFITNLANGVVVHGYLVLP